MGPSARREYVRDVQTKYRMAQGRKAKGRILKEVVENLGVHRKHAIRLLNGAAPSLERPFRVREVEYPERLVEILLEVWKAMQHPWSERLKAGLPLWLPSTRKRWELSAEDERLLLAMSPRTMDRRLAKHKRELRRRIYGKTKPGRFLRQKIPIQTESSQVCEPGFMEVDTVSHSGQCASGLWGNTVNEVDLLSGWDESMAVLGKRAEDVTVALDEMRRALPFEQKGIDSDNGEEFINWHLDRYCEATGLKRFRSRPYKKDDQAHVEQKNWTHVRKLIGWDRYDTPEAVAALNALLREEWRLLTNLFLPSVKLTGKIRKGSKLIRVHDDAKTPLDRLLESGKGDRRKLDEYRRLRKRLDPFELARIVERKLERLWALASTGPAKPAPKAPRLGWWETHPIAEDAPGAISVPFQDLQLARIRKQWARDRYLGTR